MLVLYISISGWSKGKKISQNKKERYVKPYKYEIFQVYQPNLCSSKLLKNEFNTNIKMLSTKNVY